MLAPLPLAQDLVRKGIAVGPRLGVEPGPGVAVPVPGATDAVAGLEHPHAQAQPAQPVELVHAGYAGPDDDDVERRCHGPRIVRPRSILLETDALTLLVRRSTVPGASPFRGACGGGGRTTMDFGINLATAADSFKIVKRAEELGYARAWFYDTQMLNADVFVAMGAAAVQTSKIRLATGVLIPSNRLAPVAASALASLNALAAGRIDFGVSTGFTARRTLGLRAISLARMEEYLAVVTGLLKGQTVEWRGEQGTHK